MRFLWVALALLAVACGSSGGGGPSNDQACSDLAQARCTQAAKCSVYTFQTRYGDNATCVANEKQLCVNGLAAPQTARTAQTVEACVAAYPTYSCADWLVNKAPSACGALSGSIANGSPCVFDSQCQTAYCSVPDGFGCGRCAAPQNVGDPCSNSQRCAPGLNCTKATQTCAALGQQGSACDSDTPCAGGLSCVGASSTARGTCQAAADHEGAACDPKQQTGPGCDSTKGLTCSSQSKTCAQENFAAPGQPCGSINGVYVNCAAEGFCTMANGQAQGTCTAASGEGGPCDTANGPNCAFDMRCVVASGTSGTCHMPTASLCP